MEYSLPVFLSDSFRHDTRQNNTGSKRNKEMSGEQELLLSQEKRSQSHQLSDTTEQSGHHVVMICSPLIHMIFFMITVITSCNDNDHSMISSADQLVWPMNRCGLTVNKIIIAKQRGDDCHFVYCCGPLVLVVCCSG